MKLRSLRLHGFKSFADRTTLEFRDGVTAIVGSNGCGKSNIADSVRWVLGEQRASAVRGAKMEEVIFQGATRRRPLNFAEVSLVFENDRGRVPIPQAEIEVTRKVFREGGSEYALNRNACRLRDIQGLLRDTGLGSNAYAIIEASMIETLLSDRAEERRALFEEAAGIGKYKDSRQAALRRLEAAEGDLARLQDLVAEVESKVRLLARQKRRAERHQELQARRLDLEVAIAGSELAALAQELDAAAARRAELDQALRVAAGERSTAELVLEERRIETARLSQERAAAAERVGRVRAELDAREREVMLADERRSHAEMRIAQLVREREEMEARRVALAAEAERGAGERAGLAGALEAARERLEERGEENRALRGVVTAERAAAETLAARTRSLAHRLASTDGERAASERRKHDAEERAAQLEAQASELHSEIESLGEQIDLWAGRSEELRRRLAAAEEALEQAGAAGAEARSREQAARDALRSADDEASRLSAQVEARESLERSYEGFTPAVAAVMALRERFSGVHGPLADFVAPVDAGAGAVEQYLGPLLQALVVEGLATVGALRGWFHEEWRGGGTLYLLPLDLAAPAGDPAPRRPGAMGTGPGAGWVDLLLADLVIVGDDALLDEAGARPRVSESGDGLDARGVVRLAERQAGDGILARREALARLRRDRDAAEARRETLGRERDAVRDALAEAEEAVREAGDLLRRWDAELKRAELDAGAHQQRRAQRERDRDQAAQALAALRQAALDAAAQTTALDVRLRDLSAELEEAGRADAAHRARLAELDAAWEHARDEEAELRVAVARAEAEHREAERRLASVEQAAQAAGARLAAIGREVDELRGTLEGLGGVRERAAGEIERLFARRDAEAAELERLERRLAGLEADTAAATELARVRRRGEAEHSEERHRLELRIAELTSRAERARERLEVEWGRPWAALAASARPLAEGGVEEWREELRATTSQLAGLGPVNMLAMEEHAEEERRLRFLVEQRDDLTRARDDLVNAIRQINRTAREVFLQTFATVRENFRRTFQSLFLGGECDLWLADPDDPLESPVEIHASPKGKKTQRIHLLSGGERTLTALALLFALYLVKPSPFCVLDEVDAPLDESNVGRFIQLLLDFKAQTQFIVITHNPRTMEAADWVYGVTMEDPGVSTIVGVELLGAWALGDRVA